MKNKSLEFTVSFNTLRVYSGDEPTELNEIQDVFAQSVVYVESVFNAINRLTYEIQSIEEDDADTLNTIKSCEHLAAIGKVFAKQMQEQFDRLLQFAEGKENA